MNTTRHARHRMRQRGIETWRVRLLLENGLPFRGNPDRLYLSKTALRVLYEDGLIDRWKYLTADLRLPVVVVPDRDRVVTAWTPRPKSGKRLPRSKEACGKRLIFGLEDTEESR